MRRDEFRKSMLLGLVWLALLPAAASAQSAFSGVVRDTSGGVLPGVTVEAASPALIEKVRSVVTDDQGRYTIVDLRPGVYKLTFSLTGFGTLVRDGIELASTFTAPVNVELKVGALEETVTVSGQTPVVDVQSVQRTQVLARDVLDSLPTARNMQQIGSLIPGIKLTSPDVGGSQSMEQTYMSVHGAAIKETTIQVDGMMVNSMSGNGQIQGYVNDAMNQEMTYQTSGISAETSAGGVRLNMIPREGGNQFSGAVYVGGTDGSWQSNNISRKLLDLGFKQGSAIDHISDVNLGFGGPIKRDRLWFFGSYRRQAVNDIVADNFYPDGRPGIEDQWIQNASLRLTSQVSERNKITVLYDRSFKFKGHEMGARVDPDTASKRRDPKLYYIAQAKWTSTVSSKLLIETGYSTNILHRTAFFQPGVRKLRGAPDWFIHASRQDIILGTLRTAASPERGQYSDRYVISSSVSYVTGSHAFKTGVQWGFGSEIGTYNTNADLTQRYRDGVPDSVAVYNTPVRSKEGMPADLGIYAQDSWTVRRLTVNAGARVDHFNSSIEQQDVGAGRFVPARHLDRVPNMPEWTDISPRFGVVYDLFGNAKTALKGSVGKYMATWGTGFANTYNPIALATDTRTWDDRNHDDVAQDNEIGPSNNRNFGLPVLSRRPDPDIQREYNLEYTVGIQHELAPRVSVTGVWYRRGFYDLIRSDNVLVGLSDYTPVVVTSPLNGERITVYNLLAAKQGLVDQVDTTSTNSDLRRQTYNGFELSFSARLPNGGNAFGGWTTERTINVQCDSVSDPNTLRFCDQSKLKIPFRHEVKLVGNYPLPLGLQASAALVSFAGGPTQATPPVNGGATWNGLSANWSISRTTRYADGSVVIPGLTPATLTVPLIPPGTKFLDRWNQLDVGLKKIFRIGNKQVHAEAEIFNVLNSGVVLSEIQTWGSTFGRPSSTLQPRMLRLAAQFKF